MRSKQEIAEHIHALLDEADVPREGPHALDFPGPYGLASRISIFIGMKSKEPDHVPGK